MSGDTDKPAVLIIGGLGFIGRWLALHIHKNNLASEVRLVDKVLPQLAWLAPEFLEACSQDKFMQADAAREQNFPRIFTPTKAIQYSYVFNCGGETRHSQDDSVYSVRSVALTQALAKECARRRIPAFIEFSTAVVYKSPSNSTISAGGCTETAQLKPWLKLAQHKLIAEQELEKIHKEFSSNGQGELRYTILRLPFTYGEYDTGWLNRALCLARVYQSSGEEMKWLWGKDLRVNTVHVLDAIDAAWKAAVWTAKATTSDPELATDKGGRAFNIVDEGDTSQAQLAAIIGELFHIQTGFQNTIISAFAKLNLDSVVEDVNEHVLQPWADLVAAKGIARPGPIGPFMEKELIKDSDLCISAARAKRVFGWRCGSGREKMTVSNVGDVVKSYERMGWWP